MKFKYGSNFILQLLYFDSYYITRNAILCINTHNAMLYLYFKQPHDQNNVLNNNKNTFL